MNGVGYTLPSTITSFSYVYLSKCPRSRHIRNKSRQLGVIARFDTGKRVPVGITQKCKIKFPPLSNEQDEWQKFSN